MSSPDSVLDPAVARPSETGLKLQSITNCPSHRLRYSWGASVILILGKHCQNGRR